jgi:transaldolase
MGQRLAERLRQFVFDHADMEAAEPAPSRSKEVWRRMTATGTELWLDTGDMEAAGELWCDEFTGLTTNNTLLNREVQKGTYDALVGELASELRGKVAQREAVVEAAFVLNAVHALRLVARFGCKVSVELHTDLAHDIDRTVAYGKRYHAICPDHFVIKVPFCAEGVLATRRLTDAGVPVNHTLGFSARQNLFAASIARPNYVNVFLGRLNAVVRDNDLGDGANVGEQATLASQRAVAEANVRFTMTTRQIAASLRAAEQLPLLVGVDVFTLPPKVAGAFEAVAPEKLPSMREATLPVVYRDETEAALMRAPELYEIPDAFREATLRLAERETAALTPEALRDTYSDAGFPGFLPEWTDADYARAREQGKIPKLTAWADLLRRGDIGLDALMNLAGYGAFGSDQAAMDARIAEHMG